MTRPPRRLHAPRWRRDVAVAAALALLAGCSAYRPRTAHHLAQASQAALDEAPPALTGPLTLAGAVVRAEAHSEEIAELVATIRVAKEAAAVEYDLRDPELRLSYGEGESDTDRFVTGADSDAFGAAALDPRAVPGTLEAPASSRFEERAVTTEDDSGYRLTLRLFPPNPFVRNKRVSARTARIYASVAALLDARWRLQVDIRSLFTQIHFLKKDMKIVEELVGVHEEALALTRRQAAQGLATIRDVMTASRRYLEAIADLDQLRREHSQARRDLAALVAAPAEELTLASDDAMLAAGDLKGVHVELLEREALDHRMDLSVLYWEMKAAKRDHEEALMARVPSVTYVQGSFRSQEAERDRDSVSAEVGTGRSATQLSRSSLHDDSDADSWQVDAGITVPMFAWVNREPALRQAEYDRAETKERKARERIRREIHDAVDTVRAIADSRRQYDAESEPIVREMTETLEKLKQQPGVLTPADAARIREEILESKRLRIESESEYHLAVLRLEKVLGMRLRAQTP